MNNSQSPKHLNYKKTLIKWISGSTCHGLPRIFKKDKLILQIVWFICVLLSVSGCCFFIANTIINFLKFEVTTLVKRQTKIPLELPAISICHNEMFLSSKGYDFKIQLINSAQIGNVINSTFLAKLSPSYPSLYQESINIDAFDYFSRLYSASYNSTDQLRKSYGFNLDTYMMSCFLSYQDCEKNDIIFYFENFYGNCYLFNVGRSQNGSQKSFYTQSNVGPNYGFRMEFLSRTINDPDDLIVQKGIRITLFDPNTRVNSFRGIDLASKYQTNIIIKKRITKKIAYPYSNCLDDHLKFYSSEIYQATTKQANSYSQSLCFDLCYQSGVFAKCKCADQNMPYFKSAPVCISPNEINCASETFADFFFSSNLNELCGNDCPLECERVDYDYKISLTDYPTNLRAAALVEMLNRKHSSKNYSIDFVKENAVKVNIFYDTLEYEEIEELKKMEIVDLVSSIGGLLGLFIGISVLSIAEIIELFILILNEIFKMKFSHKVIHVQNK